MTVHRWRALPPESPVSVRITWHQARLLTHICRGQRDQEIADELGLSLDTVKTTNKRLYAAMGARNRAHAAALACSGRVAVYVINVPKGEAA